MASTHSSARRGLTGRRLLFTVIAVSGVVLAPLPATAAPSEATTSAEAAELVAAKGHELEVVTEQYNDAREQLKTAQAQAEQAGAQVAGAQAQVGEARDKVREVARTAFTGERLSTLQAMLSSESADELLDRVGTLDTIADHNNDVLAAAQQATEEADAAKAAAEKTAADAQALVDQVAGQKADLDSQIADYQAQYDRLSAEEKAAALAAAAAAHQDERSAPVASRDERTASDSSGSSSSSSAGSSSAGAPAAAAPVVAGSGAAATAVSTAMAQIGKPYVWAAAGPNSFDCSGLVQYAYAAAGISLPHSSRSQATSGQAVSRSQLQPGDVIAFYSPVSHVGIYIGNGQMVHAPTSGDVVKVVSIDYMGSITAMRRIG